MRSPAFFQCEIVRRGQQDFLGCRVSAARRRRHRFLTPKSMRKTLHFCPWKMEVTNRGIMHMQGRSKPTYLLWITCLSWKIAGRLGDSSKKPGISFTTSTWSCLRWLSGIFHLNTRFCSSEPTVAANTVQSGSNKIPNTLITIKGTSSGNRQVTGKKNRLRTSKDSQHTKNQSIYIFSFY